MKNMSNSDIKNMVILELVAPDPGYVHEPTLSEEERKSVYDKYKRKLPWNEVFSDIGNENTKNKLIELFENIDKNN